MKKVRCTVANLVTAVLVSSSFLAPVSSAYALEFSSLSNNEAETSREIGPAERPIRLPNYKSRLRRSPQYPHKSRLRRSSQYPHKSRLRRSSQYPRKRNPKVKRS